MTSEQFDAVIVGAGFARDRRSHPAQAMGYENFVILDREDDLGGTWHVNRYPGLAVDVPTTTYSYFFEPNPNWSRLFSTGAEIKQYADDVADKYDVRRHMRFNTSVEGARWDEDAEGLAGRAGRRRDADDAYLITATGFLSQPNTPDIPGITEIRGQGHPHHRLGRHLRPRGQAGCHHRHRRHRGPAHPRTGARSAADLTVYQRTPIWVVPKIDFRFSERAKQLFARVPLTQRLDSCCHRCRLRVLQLRRTAPPTLLVPAAQHRRVRPGQVAPFPVDPRSRAAQAADPRLRLRLQTADLLQQLLPRLHQTERAPADQRDRTHRTRRHRGQRRHQDRHRHPRAGHRIRPVGGELPRHRDRRPRGA